MVAYLPEKALSRAEQRSRPHKDTPVHVGRKLHSARKSLPSLSTERESLYRDMASSISRMTPISVPLSEGNNVMPFEHAYSHVNAFSSAMQAYITLGSEKHLRAAKNGFEMLTRLRASPQADGDRTRRLASLELDNSVRA